MAAAFASIASALRRPLACRRHLHRLATVMALLSTLLVVGAARADAQEVVEYYGTDAVGSIRVVFAQDGTVKARSDYLPYGEEWQPATPGGPLPTQRFTGQQRDAEENLDNFNARSYQGRTGRFTTVDPVIVGALENPQRWNRYRYAANNPLKFTDPTGMYETCEMTETGAYNCSYTVGGGGGGGGSWGWIDPWYGTPSGNPYNGGCGAPICAYGNNGSGGGGFVDTGSNADGGEEGGGQIIIPNAGNVDPGSEMANVVTPIAVPGPAAVVAATPKIVSIIWRSLFGGAKTVEPQLVRFSQKSITSTFSDGRSVRGMTDDLLSGRLNPLDVPPIRLAERDGLLFTLDNRRLFAFREAGVGVPYIWATEQEIINELWKFSTKNNGVTIRFKP